MNITPSNQPDPSAVIIPAEYEDAIDLLDTWLAERGSNILDFVAAVTDEAENVRSNLGQHYFARSEEEWDEGMDGADLVAWIAEREADYARDLADGSIDPDEATVTPL